MSELNPFKHSICLTKPNRLTDVTSWHMHIPFAMFLVDILKPHVIVELGTHKGDSYCAFCQAVKELNLITRCYAIDTWQGDPQAGIYGPEILTDLRNHHDPLYGNFSTLVQSTFDEALNQFKDGTIDLLHIDGLHEYESVKHDFETWLPKLNSYGIVLFHDSSVLRDGYGVRSYFDEIKKDYVNFEFVHGNGLGIIAVKSMPSGLDLFFKADDAEKEEFRQFFSKLGGNISESLSTRVENDKQIKDLKDACFAKDEQINHLTLDKQQMQSGIVMNLLRRYQKVVEKLLPMGSRIRNLYELKLSGIRVILNEGWRSFWRKLIFRIKRK